MGRSSKNILKIKKIKLKRKSKAKTADVGGMQAHAVISRCAPSVCKKGLDHFFLLIFFATLVFSIQH